MGRCGGAHPTPSQVPSLGLGALSLRLHSCLPSQALPGLLRRLHSALTGVSSQGDPNPNNYSTHGVRNTLCISCIAPYLQGYSYTHKLHILYIYIIYRVCCICCLHFSINGKYCSLCGKYCRSYCKYCRSMFHIETYRFTYLLA